MKHNDDLFNMLGEPLGTCETLLEFGAKLEQKKNHTNIIIKFDSVKPCFFCGFKIMKSPKESNFINVFSF